MKRIPVYAGSRIIEMCSTAARIAQLSAAPNVQIVRARRSQEIVQINVLEAYGSDQDADYHGGNSRKTTWEEPIIEGRPPITQHKRALCIEHWPAVLRREMAPLYS